MSTENNTHTLFVIAARNKYRFESTKGLLQVEDLYDLNLTSLDNIAVALDEKIQKLGRKTFIEKRTNSTKELEEKLEIIKFVIQTKQKEDEERKAKQAASQQREFLKALREKKQLAQLENLSLEEIEKQIAALE